jgi:IS5 family transposase
VPRGRRLDLLAAVCRIPLGFKVPHPTTLAKLPRRLGEDVVVQLNRALLARAAEHKVLRCHKLRADTTVVGANLASPTDLGLLARAVDRRQSTVKRVQQAGGATRTRVRDRRRSARRRAHQVAQALRSRTDQAKQVVAEVLGELAALAERSAAEAARGARTTRRTWRGLAAARVGSATPWTSWRPPSHRAPR